MALTAAASDVAPSSELDAMFDLAPVSLWIEDYSGLKRKLDGWRAEGVTDLVAYLSEEPGRVSEFMALLKVLRVNQHTLKLFAADSQQTLLDSLDRVFRGDMSATVVHELDQLWRGQLTFESETVNYALDGRRLDVRVRARVLPGHEATWERVLVSLDDVTERVAAQRLRDESATYARSLFERSPVSLWVEDFSAVRSLMETLRARGITDFATFIKVHPEFVTRCMQEIRVIDVNRETLRMFGAPDLQTLLGSLSRIFRDEMRESFAEQLQDLWNGKTVQHREVLNYSLSGEVLNIHMQFAVQDDRLDTWDLVLVSLVDITARKKAEAYLEYLGKHDVLTQLRNRAYFEDELNRLERKGPWPVTIVAIDLNRLKATNDQSGHAAGDALLRRAGEVLGKVADKPVCAARIGGDEFVLLMPGEDERAGAAMIERVQALVDLNNQYYPGATLSLAMGCATGHPGERLEATVSRADERMFEAKRDFYTSSGLDRRVTRAAPLAD
jgi:diguanylate cyclase (GGDEF)-like protein